MSHFNEAANSWDSSQKSQRAIHLANEVKKDGNLKLDGDILDFGCGTGLLGVEFIEEAKSLLGVDVSSGMLEAFDLKTKDSAKTKSKNVNLEEESLERKFDLIVSSMTFHHLINPEAVLVKFSKMINPGGGIALIDLETEDGTFHGDNEKAGVRHFGFSSADLAQWAKSSQLSVEFRIVDTIEKNERKYNLFLGIFKPLLQ